MPSKNNSLYENASKKQLQKWLENGAIEIIPPAEAEKIRAVQSKKGEQSRILQMRHMYTDKNDGKRNA